MAQSCFMCVMVGWCVHMHAVILGVMLDHGWLDSNGFVTSVMGSDQVTCHFRCTNNNNYKTCNESISSINK